MPRFLKVLFLLLCALLPVQGRLEQTGGVSFTRGLGDGDLRGVLYANDATFSTYYSEHLSKEEESQIRIAGQFAIEFGSNYQRENGLGYFTSTAAEYVDFLAGTGDWWGIGDHHAFTKAYGAAWVSGTGVKYESAGDFLKGIGWGTSGLAYGVLDGGFQTVKGLVSPSTWVNLLNGNTLGAVVSGEAGEAVWRASAEYGLGVYLYDRIGDADTFHSHLTQGVGGLLGGFAAGGGIAKATASVANAAKAATLAKLTKAVPKAVGSAANRVANPVPSTMARVIPGRGPFPTLGPPGRVDVFVTAADDIAGMTPAQISQRLTIPASDTFTIFRFPTPSTGVASPIFRTDSGFIGGGRTLGGAREFVLPNGPIPSGATSTILGP